jgi:hypothetical protein
MAAAQHNFKIEQGDRYEVVISVVDANGTDIDCTQYTWTMKIRNLANPDGSDGGGNTVYCDISSLYSSSQAHITSGLGTISIIIPTAVSKILDFSQSQDQGVYDLHYTDSSGERRRLLQGIAVLEGSATRDL